MLWTLINLPLGHQYATLVMVLICRGPLDSEVKLYGTTFHPVGFLYYSPPSSLLDCLKDQLQLERPRGVISVILMPPYFKVHGQLMVRHSITPMFYYPTPSNLHFYSKNMQTQFIWSGRWSICHTMGFIRLLSQLHSPLQVPERPQLNYCGYTSVSTFNSFLTKVLLCIESPPMMVFH